VSGDIQLCRRAGIALVLAALAATSACSGGTPASSAASTTVASEPSPPAVPRPFGTLTCEPRDGIRFCPGGLTPGHDLRVPSFDGVPLDADVALPATGRGPFPLIVMLHGLGGDKTDWEDSTDDGAIDDVTMASKGYAVLMYTARGFGNSCGTAASRADTPACAKGWIHLADQRYEIRDTQYLAGELVDEGLVRPQIAVTGVSYGAGQTLELAMLKNRVRLTNGRFAPWTSPVHHVPMSIAAAYAEWPWDDLVTALNPNGALITASSSASSSGPAATPPSADLSPIGVEKQSWNTLLYGVTTGAFLAPPGADPSADITTWYKAISAGEPFSPSDSSALRELQTYHSAIGIPPPSGGVPPLVIQNGWTDTLFPVSEALHFTEGLAKAKVHNPLLLIFDDFGHGWAQGKPADVHRQTVAALSFLDSVMLDHRPPKSEVLAVGQTCPATAPSGPVLTASSWAALTTGSLKLSSATAQAVTSGGGSPAVSAALDPAYASKLCDPLPAAREPGTAVAEKTLTHATTVIGPLQVTARLHVVGNFPELVGRLWDVSASGATRQLVEAGVVRPNVDQSAQSGPASTGDTTVTFDLNPNEYTVAAGDTLELELVGSTAPWFRASNGTFTMTVTDLHATIGTH
jgi:pimeloyl-ACP methyl ester carboxylesterase